MTRQCARILTLIAILAAWHGFTAAPAAEYAGKPYAGDDLYADTWVATDGAGRVAPGREAAGPVKPGKWVGLFYWTWHTAERSGPFDTTKILAAAQGGKVKWPSPVFSDHHWGEPELGYYRMTDPFVIPFLSKRCGKFVTTPSDST